VAASFPYFRFSGAENDVLLNADTSVYWNFGSTVHSKQTSVVVAGDSLHPTDELKWLGVVTDGSLAECNSCAGRVQSLQLSYMCSAT